MQIEYGMRILASHLLVAWCIQVGQIECTRHTGYVKCMQWRRQQLIECALTRYGYCTEYSPSQRTISVKHFNCFFVTFLFLSVTFVTFVRFVCRLWARMRTGCTAIRLRSGIVFVPQTSRIATAEFFGYTSCYKTKRKKAKNRFQLVAFSISSHTHTFGKKKFLFSFCLVTHTHNWLIVSM